MFFDLASGRTRQLKTTFRGSINDPQMSRDGSGARQLTRTEFRDEDPAWSPDGRTLAFELMYGLADHKSQNPNDWFFKEGIVAVDVATGREHALTEPDPCGKNELWLRTWSPDGQLFMMTRGLHLESGEFTHDLWVMRKDGSDLQRVPNSDGIMFFEWAP